MSQIEKYAHVLPRMFYTGCTTTIGAQQAGGTKGPQGSELRMTAGAREGWYVQYSTTQQAAVGGACGWQLTGTARRLCVASRVGENNDADGRRRRSGQASGAGRKTGGREKRCVWEPGPSGRPVESCRRADVTPGMSRGGRSRRRDLALGLSRNILCSCVWPG